MADQSSLLPPNATAFERSLEIARLGDLAEPLRHTGNPDKIELDRLPWLAWGLNVDAWDDDWPEELKRTVVRRSIFHHRQKGTLESLRRAARLGGAQVVDVVLPSQQAFSGRSMTEEERKKYLSRYPEIRVYRTRDRGTRAGAMPVGPTLTVGAKMFPGGGLAHGTAFPAVTTAIKRALPRVYRVEKDGTETELTTATFQRGTSTREVIRIERTEAQRGRVIVERGGETVYQIVGPGFRGPGAMFGDPAETDAPAGSRFFLGAGAYLTDKRAHKRTFITRFTDQIETPDVNPTLARPAVQPILDRLRRGVGEYLDEGDIMSTRAELVRAPGKREGLFGTRGFIGRDFLVDHYAGKRMYLTSRLYDPDIALKAREGMFFCGVTRFGMPPYHAEVKLKIRGKRPLRAFGQHISGHFVTAPERISRSLMQSMRTSVSLRDKVLINTKTTGPLIAGRHTIAGPEYVAGNWSENHA